MLTQTRIHVLLLVAFLTLFLYIGMGSSSFLIRTATTTTTTLYEAHPHRSDIDVVFGSVDVEGDDDEVSNQREQQERRDAISSLMQQQDEEFRQERKLQTWGKYANATSKQEVQQLEQEERRQIALVNQEKQALAQQSGVTLELLGPKEESSSVYQDDQIKITAGSRNLVSNVDEELQEEWQELAHDTETLQLTTGEIVSRDALQGVRVGSAGGWTLEVFPGDFVVHRYVNCVVVVVDVLVVSC